MKDFKEIGLSFLFALIALLSLAGLHRFLQNKERLFKPPAPPVSVTGFPTDPALQLNWGLKFIHADQAWQQTRGRTDITVAIIDTGCDIHHPDLAGSIWSNPGETGRDRYGLDKASNGIDDDGNGFVDDAHGWDFVSNSPAVMDEHGHGTHVAGIIGAHPVSAAGSSGVAPHVSLMILKYYDSQANEDQSLARTIEAIHYAVKMGAHIINYSGGGISRNSAEEKALQEAAQQKILVVAAAGNEGLNSDFFHFYPADYDLPNILSVAAVDRRGDLMDVSNFGRTTVDLAAPGKNIYSTLPGEAHGYMSGTSQAAAFVTGVAALLMAQNIDLFDPPTLIDHFRQHGRKLNSPHRQIGLGQLLDAKLATDAASRLAKPLQASRASRNRAPAREQD